MEMLDERIIGGNGGTVTLYRENDLFTVNVRDSGGLTAAVIYELTADEVPNAYFHTFARNDEPNIFVGEHLIETDDSQPVDYVKGHKTWWDGGSMRW